MPTHHQKHSKQGKMEDRRNPTSQRKIKRKRRQQKIRKKNHEVSPPKWGPRPINKKIKAGKQRKEKSTAESGTNQKREPRKNGRRTKPKYSCNIRKVKMAHPRKGQKGKEELTKAEEGRNAVPRPPICKVLKN